MSEQIQPWTVPIYVDRFWSRVEVLGNDDCWEWKRGATVQGYGCFHFGHSSIRAHRFSYQLHNGPIAEHQCVCHSCDNPRCVNPAHLWLGTRAENNADKNAKGRNVIPKQLTGEGNTNSVLSTPEVVAIRVMARCGMPQARIASYLGVSTASVCMIVSGERRQEETEQRVSACVNYCAGVETESLERTSLKGLQVANEAHAEMLAKCTQQRDDLLAALRLLLPMAKGYAAISDVGSNQSFCAAVESLIAKVESK